MKNNEELKAKLTELAEAAAAKKKECEDLCKQSAAKVAELAAQADEKAAAGELIQYRQLKNEQRAAEEETIMYNMRIKALSGEESREAKEAHSIVMAYLEELKKQAAIADQKAYALLGEAADVVALHRNKAKEAQAIINKLYFEITRHDFLQSCYVGIYCNAQYWTAKYTNNEGFNEATGNRWKDLFLEKRPL